MALLQRSSRRALRKAPLVGLGTAALHLAALSSFAIALPYVGPIEKSRTFFVEQSASGLDVVVLAALFLALPPLAAPSGDG